MSYNGIGLSTVRGSATSGHVQKNLSHIRPEFFRNKIDSNTGKNQQGNASNPYALRVNNDVIEHNKKHAMEAKIYEYQEDLVDKGVMSAEEIEQKVALYCAFQIKLDWQNPRKLF
jgi:serine/arginine repetitive matrix protein 2